MIVQQTGSYFQNAAILEKPIEKILSFGDQAYQWISETPKAPLAAGVGALASELWYGFSYAGPSSAPWQAGVGALGAGLLTAGFEIYENYTLYRKGQRSLSHAVLDGVSDTLSAGFATYVGGSLGSLIISSVAAGAAVPFGVVVGAAVVAGIVGYGICLGLSALKDGILKEWGFS